MTQFQCLKWRTMRAWAGGNGAFLCVFPSLSFSSFFFFTHSHPFDRPFATDGEKWKGDLISFLSFFFFVLLRNVCVRMLGTVRVRIDVSMKADTNLRHFGCRWKGCKSGSMTWSGGMRELKEQQQPWQVVDSLTFHSMHSSAKSVDMLLSSLV